ncbi:MAG: ribosome small subunit-dependent GTPase A [Eggerthellales bacterium]|nr:ribosome small subunit-dependent GTPase A [Eggerthellales bacterium]
MLGQIVKLDRGFPLVRLEDGSFVRCKHAVDLVKHGDSRGVIGDWVELLMEDGLDNDLDNAQILRILPRKQVLIRKDPADRTQPQILAANFDLIIVTQPLAELNVSRLERELVLAYETGAQVAVVLTKADLAESEGQIQQVRDSVADMVGDIPVLVVSADDRESVAQVSQLIGDRMAVLLGRSGVGKSSLINVLVGQDVQETTPVREGDGKGRHTTVSREMVFLPQGGCVIDMPGIRGVGLWDATDGINAAFADVVQLAQSCRFDDCRHEAEPGCAVREAVEDGSLSPRRLEAYKRLRDENQANLDAREVAQRTKERRGHPRTRGQGSRGKRVRPRK